MGNKSSPESQSQKRGGVCKGVVRSWGISSLRNSHYAADKTIFLTSKNLSIWTEKKYHQTGLRQAWRRDIWTRKAQNTWQLWGCIWSNWQVNLWVLTVTPEFALLQSLPLQEKVEVCNKLNMGTFWFPWFFSHFCHTCEIFFCSSRYIYDIPNVSQKNWEAWKQCEVSIVDKECCPVASNVIDLPPSLKEVKCYEEDL